MKRSNTLGVVQAQGPALALLRASCGLRFPIGKGGQDPRAVVEMKSPHHVEHPGRLF